MKSPLKAKPLRNPGDSIQDWLLDNFSSRVFLPLIVTIFFLGQLTSEWLRWKAQTPPNPTIPLIIFLCSLAFTVWSVRVGAKRAKALKLGRDGEKVVGQFLEGFRGEGAQVFHDIPGENFNLDHVVIHPSGVYMIETKTYSKPSGREPRIVFDGEEVSFVGLNPERSSVVQARAGAKWLSELLYESCGKKIAVRPVVVYPGWFIEPTAEARNSDVWVLNPKALPSFIQHSRITISPENVKLFSFHLSRYVRATLAQLENKNS